MKRARVFLGLQAVLFIPYGLYCLLQPEMLAVAAGVAANSDTGVIELRTMYGGLQLSVGLFCAAAIVRPVWQVRMMFVLLVVFAGLAPVRVILGLYNGDLSGYTLLAMVYEAICLLFLLWWWRNQSDDIAQR